MPRNCPVCSLPRLIKVGVDGRLAKGEPLGQIARDVNLTINQLANHRREGHTKNLPMVVVGTPDSYHGELDRISQELENLLVDFQSSESPSAKRDALMCLREMAKVVEQKAKLAGAYNQSGGGESPQFQRLKELFAQFVVSHPEVKEEMLMLLDKAQYGEETG